MVNIMRVSTHCGTLGAAQPGFYPGATPRAAHFAAGGAISFPSEQRKKKVRWQILFPARLVPRSICSKGEAELSKAYLARLRRIDEMVWHGAPPISTASRLGSPRSKSGRCRLVAEFSPAGRGRRGCPWGALALHGWGAVAMPRPWQDREMHSPWPPLILPRAGDPDFSATAAGEASRVCHPWVAAERPCGVSPPASVKGGRRFGYLQLSAGARR